MAGAFRRIWTSDTAYGGHSYSATSDGKTVRLRSGPYRDHGQTVIATISVSVWDDMLDQNGEPCFFAIERLAAMEGRV
jgi:hypothetical protein